MTLIDRAIASLSPGWALRRARARQALMLVEGYTALRAPGARSRRGMGPDADGDQRQALAAFSRDLIRNTPLAIRAQQVIASNVVGDGIIPKVVAKDQRTRDEVLRLVEAHFDTTAIDADGRQNLYGLQRLAMNAVVDAGEVIIRRRWRRPTDPLPLPFQIQVIEADHLDNGADQDAAPPRDGQPGRNRITEGIEFDAIGRRVAYHLLTDHPADRGWPGARGGRVRVEAADVIHVYRQDRPAQMRGVTWFAPVMQAMRDFADYSDAQLVRQQIAACFTAFRTTADGVTTGAEIDPADDLSRLSPGLIHNLPPGEDIRFADPPAVSGYDEFTQGVIRLTAAGLGITYEALSGDLSRVNFSSARMGRMEMDRNVSAWQWLLLIPQMCQPIGEWFMEAWRLSSSRARPASLGWVPPHRMLVDPSRELVAMRDEVRAGFTSRSAQVRRLGYDPERVMAEIARDNALADEMGLTFDTDPRRVSLAGTAQPVMPDTEGADDGRE